MSAKKDTIVGTTGTILLVAGTVIDAPVMLATGAVVMTVVAAKTVGTALFKFVDWWVD